MARKVRRIRAAKRVGVTELFSLLPLPALDALARQMQVDHQVKKLNGIVFFQLLLHGVLRYNRLSTRLLEQLYNSTGFKPLRKSNNHSITHAAIALRLKNINVEFFKAIFEQAHRAFAKHCKAGSSPQQRQLLRFDSTMVALGAGLLKEGMRTGPVPRQGLGKRQLKFTIGLKDELPSDMHLFTHQSYMSEDKAIGEAIARSMHKAKSIVVFDRGVSARQVFDKMQDEQDLFVTRLRTDAVYTFVSNHCTVTGQHSARLIFTEDIIVSLLNRKGKPTAHHYRLIKAQVKGEDKAIHFLTNILDMNCAEIAELYSRRWDIEVFFKFLKQELNAEVLLSYDSPGIASVMYVRLVAAMLIIVFKNSNKIEGYKIAKAIFESELEREIMAGLVVYCGGDPALIDKYFDNQQVT